MYKKKKKNIYIYIISRTCTVTFALRTPSARVLTIISQRTTLDQHRFSDNERRNSETNLNT